MKGIRKKTRRDRRKGEKRKETRKEGEDIRLKKREKKE